MKKILLLPTLLLISISLFSQTPTIFSHTTKNNHEIVLLAEGQGVMPMNVLIDVTPEILAETMPDNIYQSATNVYLIRVNTGKKLMIDAGLGRRLQSNLQSQNILPCRIDAIFITHMHFDHIGGLIDEAGTKLFPNAYIYVSQYDYDFFYIEQPQTDREKQVYTIVNTYRDKLVLFDSNAKVFYDIVKPLPNYGHTPGHTVYLIDNDMLIWGDMVHAMQVQMPYPTVSATFDVDNKKAVEARLKMLKYIVDHNFFVGGMHIPYPGMGTLKSNGKQGYIFTPMNQK